MRGLKHAIVYQGLVRGESHLLQMRGLKRQSVRTGITVNRRIFYRCVDWNTNDAIDRVTVLVASFTDAWIETLLRLKEKLKKWSHLLQMRGLKHFNHLQYEIKNRSHLLQMRGLKLTDPERMECVLESHLLQMRGLKPLYRHHPYNPTTVASFTDAWIETTTVGSVTSRNLSHLLQMRGLKPTGLYMEIEQGVASFTDAWIETYLLICTVIPISSHLLQMRGLKPNDTPTERRPTLSHLLQMRGLKRNTLNLHWPTHTSHLLQMRGLKLWVCHGWHVCRTSHLLQMRGLKP